MSQVSRDVWDRLANSEFHGDTLWARLAAPDVTDRLLAALDSSHRRHFLVPLKEREKSFTDRRSRGLEVATKEMTLPGHEVARYLDLICHDPAGHEAFDLIGGDLAAELVDPTVKASAVAERILEKWRRFWAQAARGMLSREEQIGLFAELWFLLLWLIPKIGIDDALAAWRGPYGSRHDFEMTSLSVEAKATTSVKGRTHRINGVDQLSPPDNGSLLLFSMQLREERNASNTLPTMVRRCREVLADRSTALSVFDAGLVEAGYSDAHAEEYAKLTLRLVDEALYRIEDDFPRITPDVFVGGVPSGVEEVGYTINLSGFDRLICARVPGEWMLV
jgi:hypothetical protein